MEANDGADVSERAREFAADRENGAAALEAALAADADGEPWSFDDVALDSGTFGELVSRGIVTKVDGEYRLADPAAVRRALEGDDPDSEESTRDEGGVLAGVDVPGAGAGSRHRPRRAGRAGFDSDARDRPRARVRRGRANRAHLRRRPPGRVVVLPGNDPYRYRYWLEKLVTSDLQPWNPGIRRDAERGRGQRRVLLLARVARLGAAGELRRGGVDGPHVVSGRRGDAHRARRLCAHDAVDRRLPHGIGVDTMLALIPIHTTYTALGFGDHHALDYLLLTLVAGSLVLVVDRDPEVRIGGACFRRVGSA